MPNTLHGESDFLEKVESGSGTRKRATKFKKKQIETTHNSWKKKFKQEIRIINEHLNTSNQDSEMFKKLKKASHLPNVDIVLGNFTITRPLTKEVSCNSRCRLEDGQRDGSLCYGRSDRLSRDYKPTCQTRIFHHIIPKKLQQFASIISSILLLSVYSNKMNRMSNKNALLRR